MHVLYIYYYLGDISIAITSLDPLPPLAMFDLPLHLNLPEDKGKSALDVFNDIRKQYDVLPNVATDVLPNRFSETFTTDFASTYYAFYYWDALFAAFITENDRRQFILCINLLPPPPSVSSLHHHRPRPHRAGEQVDSFYDLPHSLLHWYYLV
jgi:hypothetical protein